MDDKEIACILIVDDEPGVLNLIKEQVAYYGYKVFSAPHAEAAFQLAKNQPQIDLLLTDIIMPGMNGIDLARAITAVHPDIRILFMSGHFDDDLFNRNFPDQDYEFMAKPFGLDTLIAKIRLVLSQPDVPLQ